MRVPAPLVERDDLARSTSASSFSSRVAHNPRSTKPSRRAPGCSGSCSSSPISRHNARFTVDRCQARQARRGDPRRRLDDDTADTTAAIRLTDRADRPFRDEIDRPLVPETWHWNSVRLRAYNTRARRHDTPLTKPRRRGAYPEPRRRFVTRPGSRRATGRAGRGQTGRSGAHAR